jgi:hypothetical protein
MLFGDGADTHDGVDNHVDEGLCCALQGGRNLGDAFVALAGSRRVRNLGDSWPLPGVGG